MVDTEKLRQAIHRFELSSAPHSWSQSKPATTGDINKLRDSIKTVLTAFVDELENILKNFHRLLCIFSVNTIYGDPRDQRIII